MFSDVETLQSKIEEYFDLIKSEKIPPTITGLALHLGFADRRSIYEYEGKPQFTLAIKKARLRIERVYEQNLHGTAPTGSIFALKNFGWRDKHEVEHSGHIETRTITTEDLEKQIQEEIPRTE